MYVSSVAILYIGMSTYGLLAVPIYAHRVIILWFPTGHGSLASQYLEKNVLQ